MIAGCSVAEFAGFREVGEGFELALMNLGDRFINLVLKHPRLIRQHNLVPAQIEKVRAACACLVLGERLDKENGGASFERFIAHPAVVDHRYDDNGNVDAMRQRPYLTHELHTVELG